MSYNGSGVFNINTAGQPVITGTTISSTTFNTLTADLATGLTTALTKDGQSTPTANIGMGAFKITNLAAGTVASDAARLDQVQGGAATFITVTGTDTLTGTVSPALSAYAAGNQFSFLVANTNTAAVTINIDGIGAKSITRTGTTALVAADMVAGQAVEIIYDGTRFQLVNGNSFTNVKVSGTLGVTGVATFTAQPIVSSLTASLPVFTDASKGLVSNAMTGTGDVVMSTSPTLVTPALGTPASGVATNLTGLPLTTGVTGTLAVANGGTGVATTTAYGILAGGTTATGAFQNIGTGTSAQVLTSNGAGALPTFQAASSSVTTVGFGTTGLTPSGATSGVVTVAGTLAVANGGTGVTTSTGTGAVVLGTSPTLLTPALGTPASGVLTSCTGLPLTTGVTGTLAVANGGTGVTTSTGSGANVLGTSPTLATPTFDSAPLATISGTAPLYMCRAWVNFNGTGTVAIRASGNVSSITDNGTGDYTVNFTTAMPDANYMATQSVGNNNYGVQGIAAATNSTSALLLQTTTQYRIYSTGTSSGTSNTDAAVAFVAIFR